MNEEAIMELKEKNSELEERVAMLEFKVKLLHENTCTSGLLFEHDITHTQYDQLMNLMDKIRKKIDNKEAVYHGSFEMQVYKITGKDGDYHFCEAIARSFMEDGRWEEVFPALYGDMEKYKYYLERT